MIIAAVEERLSRRIAESSRARRLVEALEGRTFAVAPAGLGFGLRAAVVASRLELAVVGAEAVAEASAVVEGTPLELLRLLGPDPARRLRAAAVELHGDSQVAEAFAELFSDVCPDFEELLADWVGDVPAHGIGRQTRALARWAGHAARALEADVADYLQEESDALPGRERFDGFSADVERLRDDVERAAARLERLTRRIAAGAA